MAFRSHKGFCLTKRIMKYSIFSIILLLFSTTLLQAQNGTVRGTVIDESNGETIIGANIVLEGTSTGTTTDLDGNFNLSVAPGTYTLVFSSISYSNKTVTDVVVKAGEVTVLDVRLGTNTEEINEVVISATRTENTENALLTIQKKSVTVLDGISSESISKAGDSDAASALQRVPGVSVEGGKYVYVRGLGDRYTKTTFNGMEIPGLDPDRNTVQMDVFPTNLVDNIIVYKTFSPDLPGDFTGGVVDISTKAFPDTRTIGASVKFGYNTATTFNKDFILYKGGKTDWLGIDDGTRELPFSYDTEIGNRLEVTRDAQLTEYTKAFSRTLQSRKQNNFFDQSYSVSFGDQFNIKDKTLGINFGLTYKNTYQFYENAEFGTYQHDADPTYRELDNEFYQTSSGAIGSNNILWSGLLGAAFKVKEHKFTAQVFHTQNGESTASSRSVYNGFDNINSVSNILTYTERSITNFLLTGKHHFNKLQMEWKNSVTLSNISDPDLRIMEFRVSGTDTVLEGGGSARAFRLYRDLNEINENFRVDFTYEFKQWSGLTSKLRFGVYDTYKVRDFKTYVATLNNDGEIIQGGADWLMLDQNIWTPENRGGTYVIGNQDRSNTYNSSMNVFAAYVMNELPISRNFNIIYGVRVEKADIWFTGQRQQVFNPETDQFDNEKVLNKIDVMPSINMIYNVIENMNLRLSYSRTVARPSFKEISLAEIADPITETTFIGNLDVKETQIDNLDLRWEYFFNTGEMISVSGFFKNFTNPIELVIYDVTTPRDITPRNVENAKAFGIELEIRKNFKFIHEKLEGLSIGGNFTYVKSITQMSESEIKGRQIWAREGQTIGSTRAMFGQSPWMINANISYTHRDIGLTASLVYNVQGQRLVVVGGGRTPDVYEMPFHGLNFKLSEEFGKKDQYTISFTAQNLISDDRLRQYRTEYGSTPQTFSRFVPGRSFSVSFALRFR